MPSMSWSTTSLRDGYAEICERISVNGSKVVVRDRTAFEMEGVHLRFDDPRDSLPIGTNRKLVPAIGAIEALQLMGGFSHPELMCKIAPNFRRYTNAGVFHGAYGPRIRAQLKEVVELLEWDPTTRQAVMTVWRPGDDLQVGLRDVPCTCLLQFLIRDGALNLHVYMRSNDVYLGLAYDVFQFTQLQLAVANILNIPVGRYHHHVASMHAYADDRERIHELTAAAPHQGDPPWFLGFNADTVEGLQDRALKIVEDDGIGTQVLDNETVRWYRDTLSKYLWAK